MTEIVQRNKAILSTNRDNFQRTFGVPLHRFMHLLFGFDVIAFDAWLGVPDGVSTQDTIIERYGSEACDMVYGLLG